MKLLLDVMCGGLTSYLRMCGHDTVYALDRGVESDDRLLAIAHGEERTLVTRDIQLAERADRAILLDATATETQLLTLRNAGVRLTLTEPTYCGRCNGSVRLVGAEETIPEYAPDPTEERVWQCQECEQCFWKGSHWERVQEVLSSL